MDCMEAIRGEKGALEISDSARIAELRERLERTLHNAAEIEVGLSRADGTIRGAPRYSLIEGRAHELREQLSRDVQQQQMRELNASHAPTAKCPDCTTRCALRLRGRGIKSVDGETELQELDGDCPRCRWAIKRGNQTGGQSNGTGLIYNCAHA